VDVVDVGVWAIAGLAAPMVNKAARIRVRFTGRSVGVNLRVGPGLSGSVLQGGLSRSGHRRLVGSALGAGYPETPSASRDRPPGRPVCERAPRTAVALGGWLQRSCLTPGVAFQA
jgi:hypothetical protein